MVTGLDLSMWPPALAFALVVIVCVCHVLPDVLETPFRPKTSRPLSTAGTPSAQPSTVTQTSKPYRATLTA